MSKVNIKIGKAPGSIDFTGLQKMDESQIHQLLYNNEILNNHTYAFNEEINYNKDKNVIEWIDIRGIHDIPLIETIGAKYEIHNLILEDVADTFQRPKYEEYSNGIFLIVKALTFNKIDLKVETEQVALFFKENLVISFQERETDLFNHVRNRLTIEKARIRKNGPDYLCYALIDTIVDNYYIVLEDVEDVIETFERKLLSSPEKHSKSSIHRLKRELIVLRKSIVPLREAINKFSKTDSSFVSDKTSIYIRDLYDHTVQVMDSVESYRDILNGLQDLYLSEVSFKMNKVMQVLTVISAIFIPLTFLAGIYGMNFDNMPELHAKNGYFYLLAVMVILFVVLIIFFKKKKWF